MSHPDDDSTAKHLAKLAQLANEHGCDSDKVSCFMDDHRYDSEFVELGELALNLKRVFSLGLT